MVYRAYQPVVHRDVAIKVIQPEFANHPDFIRRFEVEAQLVARLEHPHIVPLYDYWRDPSGAYLVMRWLKGGSLAGGLARGPWNPAQAVPLVEQIAAALALAHRQGVVHCDIKPANILLDEAGYAYLSDFGISRLTGPPVQSGRRIDIGSTSSSSGSLGYLSPEVSRGQEATPLADIYSFGVVLYELLAGRHPFPGLSGQALIARHLSEPLPSIRKTIPDLPEAVDAVIQCATAKEPSARYPDARSLASAFRKSLRLEDDLQQTSKAAATLELRNPYKGLQAFQEADAGDFFGRQTLVQRLLARLALADGSPGNPRFLAVVGPSGSGKSSVVQAGLLPALRQGALPGSDGWYLVDMSPGADPLESLENALLQIASDPPKNMKESLRSDPHSLAIMFQSLLPDADSQALLFIDQLEELFTEVNDEKIRDHFLNLLAKSASNTHSRLRVVVTLRADFYDRPLQHGVFGALIRESTEVVLPMTTTELTEAVRGPAERVGVDLEPALLSALVADIADQPGSLPLLQYTLTDLFENRQDQRLSLQSYQGLGGVLGALSQRAERIFQRLEAAEQAVAQQLFLRLVNLGEGTEDTRRRVLQREMRGLTEDSNSDIPASSALQGVMDRFGQARLLTFDHDPATREPTIEVAHEALLREWPRLRAWLDDSRDDIRTQRLLGASTMEWQESGKDPGFLLRGTRLDQFSAWTASASISLTEDEQAYLHASLKARQERQAVEQERQAKEVRLEVRSRRFLWSLVGVFAVATLVAVILSLVAFNQQGIAQNEAQGRATQQAIAEDESRSRATQQAIAEEKARIASAGQLGSAALSMVDQQPDLAMLLSVEAYRQSPTLQNWTTLYSVGTNNSQLLRVLRGHTGRIESLVFSLDGTTLASGGLDGTARLWDMVPGSVTYGSYKQLPHALEAPVFESVAFSPDGGLLAASTTEGHVLVWDTNPTSETYNQLLINYIAAGELVPGRSWVTFSPTDPLLAAAPKNGRVELFDIDRGSPTFGESLGGILEGQFFTSLAFSPDGETLASGEIINFQVSLWHLDLSDPGFGYLIDTLIGFDTCVESVEFSPDGKLLAAGLCNPDTWVWNVESGFPSYGKHIATLSGHEWLVLNIAFSPDSTQLASVGGWGESALIWDVNPDSPTFGEQTSPPLVQDSFVDSVAYSPDGGTLAVGAADGGILLWNMTQDVQNVLSEPLNEKWINLGPGDSQEFKYPHPLETILSGHSGGIEGVAFSPDGKILASGAGGTERDVDGPDEPDYTLRLWDVDPDSPTFGKQIGEPLAGHTDGIYNLAYDPDGTRVASSSWDGTVRLWDVDPGSPSFGQTLGEPLGNYGTGITDVDFSPDGVMLATCDELGAVYLWDVDPNSSNYGETLLGPIQVNEIGLENIAFSPDGKLLAAAPWGAWNWGQALYDPIRLYDADPESQTFGELIINLMGEHTAVINRVEFHPEGKMLASASNDETIRLWDVDPNSPNFGRVIGAPLVAGHQVFGITFSPEGEYLVSGTVQVGTLQLWDVDRDSPTFGQPLGVPLNQENVYAINMAYSPDGKFFAVGDLAYLIHLWNVDPQAWVALNCERAGRNLTEVEWNQYLSWAGPYDPKYQTCPQWPTRELSR